MRAQGCVLSLVQFSSVAQSCPTLQRQASLSITNSRSLLKLMSIKSVMPFNHLILCHPLLFPPSIFSSIRVFSNESVLCIKWPKDWSFSFSITPYKQYLGLISFKIDWLDLLAVQASKAALRDSQTSRPFGNCRLRVKWGRVWHDICFLICKMGTITAPIS